MIKLLREAMSFGIIGVLNTILGTAIMYGLYNLLGANYWVSSAANYICGSIFSYFMNKKFTFHVANNSPKYIVKFILNITICYLVAYGIAQKITVLLLVRYGFENSTIDNISMFLGMILFVGLNFCGQRYFVFGKREVNV